MNTIFPPSILLEVKRKFLWKLFAILVLACAVAFVAVLPYTLTLQSETLKTATLPMPLPLLLVVQGFENVLLFAAVGGVGYLLATRIGLGLPFIEGWLTGQPIWPKLTRVALIAAVLGILCALLIVALDAVVFGPGVAALLKAAGVILPASINPPAWQGLLASLYGGITEEVLLRLGALTLLAWLGRAISHTQDGRPSLPVLWVANVLAAVLFGLGHLPMTQATGIPITTLVIVRAVVLNGTLGVVAGWLYWKWGLESSMIAHFSGDLVLHVLLPLIAGGMA